MKNQARFLIVLLALFIFGTVPNVGAAGKEGEWVRIPSNWLLHRFVRPSTAPAHTYRVALALPPGSKQVRVVQSSGISDVDQVAADFALDSILNNGPLKAMAKSKELYFQFVLTPPMLDIKMRSVEGQRPAPPDKELYTPLAETIYTSANQNETTSRAGKLTVIFPPQGGYASEAIVTVSTGNPAVDRYYLHSAALNWQTTHKSSTAQVLHREFSVAKPQRWQSILDQ
ncbi:MAG: hypothetical protein QOE34_2692 [Verrucomicrobiota bacterium]|jgi:hypothetical protein